MHFRGRREIESAAYVMRDDYARPPRHWGRDDQALPVSARERHGRRLGAGSANLKAPDKFRAEIDRARSVEPSPRDHPLPERTSEEQVFPQRHIDDQSIEIAILRNHRHRAALADSLSANDESSRARLTRAGEQLDQFGLPVAVNPREPHDLTRRDSKSTPIANPR